MRLCENCFFVVVEDYEAHTLLRTVIKQFILLFLIKQVTSVHLLSTHFARSGCTAMGGGCQDCTAGSKDPNHQSVHKYSTHFAYGGWVPVKYGQQ